MLLEIRFILADNEVSDAFDAAQGTDFTLKLGKRLKQLDAMVPPGYDHIWDCCCDHGLLGATLLSRAAAPHIHFVDVVPALVSDLQVRLQQFQPASSATWTAHCIDAHALPLAQYDGRHLIIIAGVGGDLTGQLVEAIQAASSDLTIDFLLCPVRQQFALRNQLIRLNFALKHEALLEENRRYYEILFVSSKTMLGSQISQVGELIWQAETPEQAEIARGYLTQTLNHYQRALLNAPAHAQHILQAYEMVQTRCDAR